MEDLTLLKFKAIYRFNVIPVKLCVMCSTRLGQIVPKFLWKCKGTRIVKAILRKKNKARVIILPGFRQYYKTTIIKILWYCNKNRHINQWNKIDNPEIYSHTYGQLFFCKRSKNVKWGKDKSSASGAGKVWHLHLNQWS